MIIDTESTITDYQYIRITIKTNLGQCNNQEPSDLESSSWRMYYVMLKPCVCDRCTKHLPLRAGEYAVCHAQEPYNPNHYQWLIHLFSHSCWVSLNGCDNALPQPPFYKLWRNNDNLPQACSASCLIGHCSDQLFEISSLWGILQSKTPYSF